MTDFSNIDPNFRVEPTPEADGLVYRDACDPAFSLLGLAFEQGCYRRLPAAVAKSVSAQAELLHTHTAGGCLAFLTDSKRITLRVKMHNVEKMPHFALTGSGGFDLYERKEGAYRYLTTFIPPFAMTDGFSSQRVLEDRRKRELRLYFPLYSGVTALSIGLEDIRDVIAFPKVQNASELMTKCPAPADAKALEELAIAIVPEE